MTEFTIGDICKEIQRIQFDLEVKKDVESAIYRCKTLDDLLYKIEEGEHNLVIENKYKRFDIYFDDYMQLCTVSDNENDNMLYPCTTENMANEFAELLNELNDEKEKWKSKANKKEKGVLDD